MAGASDVDVLLGGILSTFTRQHRIRIYHKSLKILESKTSRDGHEDNGMRDPIGGLVSLVDLTGNKDPIDEDGDTRVSDSEVSVSLGEIFSGGRKSRESNIGDSDNTGDGGKIVGEAIGACSGGIEYSITIWAIIIQRVRISFMGKREDGGDDLNGGVGSVIYRVKEAFMPKFSSWIRLRAGVVFSIVLVEIYGDSGEYVVK
nr:hypothetical protein [Tanacetum cinerariifolium]